MKYRYRLFLTDLRLNDLDYEGGATIGSDYVKEVAEGLRNRGQVNPVLVTQYGDRLVVHPGKSRCKAAERLGWVLIRALVYCPNGGWVEGEEISPEGAQALFSEDCRVEYSERFFAVKKDPWADSRLDRGDALFGRATSS